MVKSKKAISPILATLLLVVIAVAAIVVTYAWIMTYMSNAGHQAGVIIYRGNTSFYNVSGTFKISVDIGDSGTQDTTLIALYVGTSTSTLVNQTMTPVHVTPSQLGTITINYNWTYSVIYYFRTLTSSGLSYDWTDQAPVS